VHGQPGVALGGVLAVVAAAKTAYGEAMIIFY